MNTLQRLSVAGISLLALGTLTACGGDDTSTTQAASQGQQAQQAGARGSMPGSGEVVEVSGSTAQVQGQSSQTAVTWTDATTFTQQVAGTAADVTAGVCVFVQAADTDAEDTESGSTDAVTASSVRVTQPVDGECGGFGGGPGGQGGGTPPFDAPEGMTPPTDRPDDVDAPRRSMGANGTVASVTDTGFTVTSTQPGSDETTTVTVTTSADTTYTTTADATAVDVTVGSCVTSRGESDSTGALTATSIAISAKVDDACTGGMNMRPQGESE